MKKIAAGICLFLIILTLIGASIVAARGDSLADYRPNSFAETMDFLTSGEWDYGFNHTVDFWLDLREFLDNFRTELHTFDDGDGKGVLLNVFETVAEAIGMALGLLGGIVWLVIMVLYDIVETVAFVIYLLWNVTTLKPLNPII